MKDLRKEKRKQIQAKIKDEKAALQAELLVKSA